MWELDCEENWALKNWCFWTVVLEKTLESPLDCKEIQPVHPKGNQSWVFIRRTDADAETPVLWPPDAKRWLIWKDPDAEKDWRQKEKGTTENEMVGWHHGLKDMGLGGLWELVMDKEAWHAVVHGVAKSRTWLSDWTELDFSLPGLPVHHQSQSYSNSCPLSRWCRLTVSSSVISFSSCPQSFPTSGSFTMLCMRGPRYWSFSFSISPSNEYSGLIFFRIEY